jgi:hypothetical protein
MLQWTLSDEVGVGLDKDSPPDRWPACPRGDALAHGKIF